MEFILCIFAVLAVCVGESYWQLQLSPESIGSVPFGSSHITVWEHATSKGRYYAMPIVCLQSESAQVIENVFSRKTELEFKVLLWSREARETIHHFLTSHINASIVEEQVELLPMERIRIIWKGDPLPDFYQLADQWRSNTHLPTVVTFSVTCQNNETCQELQNAIRTRPSTFKHMEMEYEINSQRSARRRLTVHGRHLVGGSLYASLETMPVTSPIRYLRSEDVKRLTTETLTNVISSQITDEDYVDTDDEVSMMDLLQRVFDQTKVSTADFQPVMWQSVYWNPDNARPDKITSYMNRIFSRDATNSSNLSINQSQRSAAAEAGYSGFFGLFSTGGRGGSSSRSSVRKENVLQSLRERDVAVQWTGERFVPKPVQLSRLNLATLNASSNIATSNVQIKRQDSIQSIKLRVDCDVNQTSRLTPELVQANVERFMNRTETEQNELVGEVQALASVLQKGHNMLADVLHEGLNALRAEFKMQNGLQALDMISSDMRHPVLTGYCYRSGYCSHHSDSAVQSVRHKSVSRQRLKTLCNQDAACKAINDYIDNSNGGRIYREISCPPAAFTSGGRYYMKISAVASYAMRRELSEIVRSTSLNATIQPILSPSQSDKDEFCKQQFGDEYRHEE